MPLTEKGRDLLCHDCPLPPYLGWSNRGSQLPDHIPLAFTMSVTDNQTSLGSGIFPAISVNKDATVIRVTALQHEPVSPKVTKEREEYLLSSSHRTTATPLASPKERKLRM